MEHLYERVSYLKGLAEGLGINEESKEGKLLVHIVDALEDFADAIVELAEDQEEIVEYVEFMDEDLTDIEEEIFGEYDLDEMYEEDDEEYDFEDIEN